MEVIRDPALMATRAREIKLRGDRIGFVPTMGFLHRGHLSLLEEARRSNDYVVLSIFVNPLQFGPTEDYAVYPRDTKRDLQMARQAGCDLVFMPRAEQLYPKGYSTFVEVTGPLTETLCALTRPGHFRGVTTIVVKLFNLVRPDRAYFGQKDAQQARVVQKMVRDLNLDLEVVVGPTVREKDGLALSSRHRHLRPAERVAARILYRSLKKGEAMILQGERRGRELAKKIKQMIEQQPLVRIDYVAVVDAETLQEIKIIENSVLLMAAAFVGRTRLIDNLRCDFGNI